MKKHQIDQIRFEKEGKFNDHVLVVTESKYNIVPKDYDYSDKKRIRIALMRALAYFLSFIVRTILFPTIIKGKKNLKRVRRGLLTSNHISFFDSLPIRNVLFRRRLYITVAEFNNRKGFLGVLLRYSGCLPFSKSKKAMLSLDSRLKEILNRDKQFILFYPEVALWPGYQKIRTHYPGVYHYAYKTNNPIIPTFYTFKKVLFFKINYLHILEPVYPDLTLDREDCINKMRNDVLKSYKTTYENFYHKQLTYDTLDKNNLKEIKNIV